MTTHVKSSATYPKGNGEAKPSDNPEWKMKVGMITRNLNANNDCDETFTNIMY